MDKSCDLYLRLRAEALPADDELEALLRETKPAAVLLIGAACETAVEKLRRAIDPAQRQTVAILIENDAGLAQKLDADGMHLRSADDQLSRLRGSLGENKSIGVSCKLSRHEAMTMAEAGADYIAFGDPALPGKRDLDAVAEMIDWWNALFEVPCVAWLCETDSLGDAQKLVQAGADFLCVGQGVEDSIKLSDVVRMRSDFAKTD